MAHKSLPVMARRNAVRRKQLDDGQHQEAMKVLKKYVQNKYRGSMIISQQDLLDTGQQEPLQRPQSLLVGSRTFDRQSTTFSFAQKGFGGLMGSEELPGSPKLMSLDFEEQPKVLEEMKYDSKKDTILTYPIRVIKAIMQVSATKQLICLLLIALIGLIGGAVFQSLEQPNQILELWMEKNTTNQRHKQFSHEILVQLFKNECFYKMINSKKVQFTQENSFCHRSLVNIFKKYDDAFRNDHGITKQWEWDYWNSVFFAGTVFTTIGYGILAPKTVSGRIAFIIYAIVSIPMLLGVMNVFGEPILKAFRVNYTIMKSSEVYRFVYTSIRRKGVLEIESGNLEMDRMLSDVRNNEEKENENEVDEYEKVPWQIAVIILIGFLVMCSWLFTLWEDWTFFESFYFTFTSLTTVGFGDVVPQHPRFALILFVFYICGLFVVSTIYAYMQSKIEEKYFWALQLVDQSGHDMEHENSPDNIRWRSPGGTYAGISLDGRLNTEEFNRKSTVMVVTNQGDIPIVAPPSVNALIRTLSMKRNSLARSESVISKSSYGSKWRPFSNSPSASEQLTPIENKKMWMADSGSQSSFHIGPKPATSAPSLVPLRNLTGGVALSVITEVNDEDTLHPRGGTQKDISELLKKSSSIEETRAEDNSFEMIDDDAIDEGSLEDVVESATDEDSDARSNLLSETTHSTDIPTTLVRSRRLQRTPAQDLETPPTESVPILITSLPSVGKSDSDEEEPDKQVIGL